MNEIKLKYDPFQNKCTISMNGAPLPRYSALNSYANQMVLEGAFTLLQDISDELNDDFSLTVEGSTFEINFLRDLQARYPDCVEFITEKYEVDLMERYYQINSHVEQLNLTVSDLYKEKIYSEIDVKVDKEFAEIVENVEDATICVVATYEAAKEIYKKYKGQLVLYVGEKAIIKWLNNTSKYIWCTTSDKLEENVKAILERFAIPKYIEAVSKSVKEVENRNIKELVDEQKKMSVSVSVNLNTNVFEGDIISPEFCVTSEQGNCPKIRMESMNENVIQVVGSQLFAVHDGKTEVRFYVENEIDAFENRWISVRPNNFVKSISLELPEIIKEGESYNIATSYIPADAPDICNAKWYSSNPKIVLVKQGGILEAVTPGNATISVETERANAKIDVEILPAAKKIQLSKKELNLYIGEKKKIEVSVTPENCYPEKIVAVSSNIKIADISKNDIGEWIVTGKGIEAGNQGKGKCKILFTTDNDKCQSVCEITVESTMSRNTRQQNVLSRTAVCVILAFVLQFLPKVIGSLGAIAVSIIAIAFGIGGIIKFKNNIFWQILLMMLAGCIIVFNILLML